MLLSICTFVTIIITVEQIPNRYRYTKNGGFFIMKKMIFAALVCAAMTVSVATVASAEAAESEEVSTDVEVTEDVAADEEVAADDTAADDEVVVDDETADEDVADGEDAASDEVATDDNAAEDDLVIAPAEDKANPDTGVEGALLFAGAAVAAAGVMFLSSKRK